MTHAANTAMDTTAILRFLAEINIYSPYAHKSRDPKVPDEPNLDIARGHRKPIKLEIAMAGVA